MAWTYHTNTDNPRGYAYAILATVLLGLTWITVLARLAARYSIKSLGMDDACIFMSQLAMTAFCIAALGYHNVIPGKYPATLALQREAISWLVVNEASFSIGMLFLKLSLGALFLRLIHLRIQRTIVYCAMVLSTVVNFYAFWLGIFACGPHVENYLMRYLLDQCVPRSVLSGSAFAQAAANTATDITFALIPFLLLRKSQLPKNVKYYVGGILILATVGVVASVVRFWYIEKLFLKTNEVYRQLIFLGLVGLVELGIGIIASSIPALRPLFRSFVGYTTSLYGRSSRKATMQTGGSSTNETVSDDNPSTAEHTRNRKLANVDVDTEAI